MIQGMHCMHCHLTGQFDWSPAISNFNHYMAIAQSNVRCKAKLSLVTSESYILYGMLQSTAARPWPIIHLTNWPLNNKQTTLCSKNWPKNRCISVIWVSNEKSNSYWLWSNLVTQKRAIFASRPTKIHQHYTSNSINTKAIPITRVHCRAVVKPNRSWDEHCTVSWIEGKMSKKSKISNRIKEQILDNKI
jgi:hypothetical protein